LEPSLHTHFSHVQISCNNLVDRTLTNIEFIGDYSFCQTSVLTIESPHTVDVCACRGGAFRSLFIFTVSLPFTKSVCHRNTRVLTQSLPNARLAFWAYLHINSRITC
jgi:hypothetical protein